MVPKLVLETGEILEGSPFGAIGETFGELVFNTSITGYEEIITDPSYKGQIVVMTNPHISNYGVNYEDVESSCVCIEGLVVYEDSRIFSNYKAKEGLNNFLKKNNIVGICAIDTRYITKVIRNYGSVSAMITYKELSKTEYMDILKSKPSIAKRNLVPEVSTRKPYIYNKFSTKQSTLNTRRRVCIIDYGVKRSILNELEKIGFAIEVVPFNTQPKKLLERKPLFYLFSNGPGDPQKVKDIAKEQVQTLVKENQNLLGICLGHQLVSLSLGVPTYKLLFGHHGGNHPVKDLESGKIYITSQNHNFAVREKEAEDNGFIIKYRNLYDGTVEGMYHSKHNIFSVQFHPEAGPGPVDTKFIFGCAIEFFSKRNK